jgi:hypothetical protein
MELFSGPAGFFVIADEFGDGFDFIESRHNGFIASNRTRKSWRFQDRKRTRAYGGFSTSG